MKSLLALRDSPLEDQVGNTPLLDLSHLAPDGVRLLAKAEWANPGGSVKDRAALRIVRDAEARGDLHPGKRLLDATSGNTGIAYAWLGAARGFGVTLCISEGVSPARKRILEAFGAELIYTDPAEVTDGAIRRARELAQDRPERYWYADQYNNPSNILAHETTTGPEIWRQTHGTITHFVAGLGTTGTLTGTGRFLRRQNPAVQLVGVQPDQPFHGLEGLKHLATAIRPGIYDKTLVDSHLAVRTEDAYQACRDLARNAGTLVGISSGAAWHAALQTAHTAPPGSTIVTLFADHGERYLDGTPWRTP